MPHDGKTTVYALWTKCKPIGSPEKLWSKMASKETSKTTNKNCSMYKKSESNSPIFYYVLLKCYQKYAGNLRGTLSFPLCIFIQKICFGEKKRPHCTVCNHKQQNNLKHLFKLVNLLASNNKNSIYVYINCIFIIRLN